LAYVQYTHHSSLTGHLIRIIDGFHSERSECLELLASRETLWHTFMPLQAAISRGIFCIAGNVPIPEKDKAFPVFRNACVNPIDKSIGAWWLWDGQRQWRVDALDGRQEKFPFEEIINDTLLIERLEGDWHPGKHPWF
jgi:hypothetical protein